MLYFFTFSFIPKVIYQVFTINYLLAATIKNASNILSSVSMSSQSPLLIEIPQ